MAEEKSIFSKLKPINLGDETSHSSFANSQSQSVNFSNQDISIKNELMSIKEKILLLEKILIELDKKTHINIDESIKKQLANFFEEYLKKFIEILEPIIEKKVLEDINNRINNFLTSNNNVLIEEIKKIFYNIYTKNRYDDNTSLNEKDRFIDLDSKIEELSKRIVSLSENFINLNIELKNFSKEVKTNLEDLKKILIERNRICDDKIFLELNNINDNLLKLHQKFDKYNEVFDKLLYFENKAFSSQFGIVIKDIKDLLIFVREFKEKIYSDTELKDNTYLKRYLVYFIELEKNISKLEIFLNKFLVNDK